MAVASRVFAMRAGERTGVLVIDDGGGRRQFEIVRLVRVVPGRQVAYAEVAEEIERGLKSQPVDRFEWTAWFLRLERLYKVSLSDNL